MKTIYLVHVCVSLYSVQKGDIAYRACPRTIGFLQFKSLCLSFVPHAQFTLTIHPQYLQVKQGLSRSKLLLNHIQHQQPWRHMYADEKGGGMKRVDTASPAHICVACIRLKSKPSPALVFFFFLARPLDQTSAQALHCYYFRVFPSLSVILLPLTPLLPFVHTPQHRPVVEVLYT